MTKILIVGQKMHYLGPASLIFRKVMIYLAAYNLKPPLKTVAVTPTVAIGCGGSFFGRREKGVMR